MADKGSDTVSFQGLQIPLCHFTSPSKYLLGRGAFGSVYKRHCKETNGWVAVKEMHLQLQEGGNKDGAYTEAKILFQMKHDNIVSVIGLEEISSHNNEYNIVMEFLPHGSLSSFLQDPQHSNQIPWGLCWRLLIDVATGLTYLHSLRPRALVHSDLKADNVLLTSDLRAKITDFGLSVWKTFHSSFTSSRSADTQYEGRCTTTHCAPEWLENINLTRRPSLDVFSYGILIWEVITKKIPFQNAIGNEMLVAHGIMKGQRPDEGGIPKVEAPHGDSLATVVGLMKNCWNQKPESRPTAQDTLETLSSLWGSVDGFHEATKDIELFISKIKIIPRDFLPRAKIDAKQDSGFLVPNWQEESSMQETGAESDPLFIPRSDWNAKVPRGDMGTISKPFKFVIVGHTVTGMYKTIDECKQIMMDIQMFHFQRKYSDIGYNFVIGGDGNIYEGRGFDTEGSHTWRWNKKSLGVAFTGQFNDGLDKPTPKMIQALDKLLKHGLEKGKLDPNYILLGQCQTRGFDSPGKNVFEELEKMEHWRSGWWSPENDCEPETPNNPPNAYF